MIRVFKSKAIIEALTKDELAQLEADFKAYKSGNLPDLFGRDVLYDHPHNLPIIRAEEVRHIHLGERDNPWSIKQLQYYRTSDEHLVYCQGGSNIHCYLLMTILLPSAHDKAKNNNIMFQLAKMAEKFRSIY